MALSNLSDIALRLLQVLSLASVCMGQEWQNAVPYAPNGFAALNYTPGWSAEQNLGKMTYFSSLNMQNFWKQQLADKIKSSASISDCQQDITLLIGWLVDPKKQSTTFRYIDAAAKPPKGLMNGNLMWVGDYQECNSIEAIQNPSTNKSFKGKYFTAVVYMNKKPVYQTMPLLTGVCFPDSCTDIDVTLTMDYALSLLDNKTEIIRNLNLSVVGAVHEQGESVHGGLLATIIVSGIIVFIIILGTLVDIIHNLPGKSENESKVLLEKPETVYSHDESSDRTGLLSGEVFTDSGNFRVQIQDSGCSAKRVVIDTFCAFSFLSNAKKLFGTETAKGPLACLNGIRVLSMWWVILGHTYVFVEFFLDNAPEALKITQRFTFQPVLNGTFSVDSFFFLSGLLVAYLSIKEIKEKGMGKKFWIYFVCHRYWRLTPLYGFIILLYVNVTPHIISGPYWVVMMPGSQFRSAIDECKSSWWANLLYINNFYPYYGNIGKTCMGWGWYLANDMQFYLIFSPVLIFFLSRDRRLFRMIGLSIAGFLIVDCIVIRGVFVGYYGILGLMGQVTKNADDPLSKNGPLYARPYTRSSVYIIGLLVGYVLAKCSCRVSMPKLAAVFGWASFISVGMSVIFGQYYYAHHSTQMPIVASGFYVSLCRTLWGLCLAWLVLACVSGRAGPVRSILSWKIWAPLGRLTYAAYLIHPILIYAVYLNKLEPIHFTDMNMIYLYMGNLVLSYALAFVLSMMVEAPMIQLEKVVIKNGGMFMGLFKRGLVNSEQ